MNARALKMILTARLLALLLLSALPAAAQADYYYTNSYGIWEYTPTNGPVTITGFIGSGKVTIPDIINDYPVVAIGAGVFGYQPALTGVIIPASVTSIGNNAFEFCSGLHQAYFLGNAPSVNGGAGSADNSVFYYDTGTAYYLPGATGWGSTFGGWPTAMNSLVPPWLDGTDLGGGWERSSWFGDFYVNSYPWIYHAQHGWLYVFGTDPASVWLYSPSMGFLWTGSDVYPWLWSDTQQTWLYYDVGSSNPRWFYNWNQQKWTTVNP